MYRKHAFLRFGTVGKFGRFIFLIF